MNEAYILALWVILILLIAITFKTWITPKLDTTDIVMRSLIWPFTLVVVVVWGVSIGIVCAVGWALSTIVESISNKIRSKDK